MNVEQENVFRRENTRMIVLFAGIFVSGYSVNLYAVELLPLWAALVLQLGALAAAGALLHGKLDERRNGVDISAEYVNARVGMSLIPTTTEPLPQITWPQIAWMTLRSVFAAGVGWLIASLFGLIMLFARKNGGKLGDEQWLMAIFGIFMALMGPSFAAILTGRVPSRSF